MGRFYGKKKKGLKKNKKKQNLLHNNNRNCRCRGGGVDRQGENTHRGLQQRPIMTLPFFSLLERFFFFYFSFFSVRYKVRKKKNIYLFIYRKNAKLFWARSTCCCVSHTEREREKMCIFT